MMRVIEYQHRGLPHAHIVFQLTNAPTIDDKIASLQYIDKYVFFFFAFECFFEMIFCYYCLLVLFACLLF